MNKQQLAQRIWEAANKMRSKIEANEYKDYILGFMFYKYICEQEEKMLRGEGYGASDLELLDETNGERVQYIQDNLGYFIAYENLFSTWLAQGNKFDVGKVRDALSAFSRLIGAQHKKTFDGIFKTLETGLSKLGSDAASQTKAISALLQLIKDIPMGGKQDYDVLGFIYEYLISMFAANAGKKAGEFYTPHEVSLLMSEIVAQELKGKDSIKIYDPTSGSGSLLINIGHSVAKHLTHPDNIKYYAQELKENTYNLTRMNLIMRGIKSANIITRNADTLEDDWPYFDESDPAQTYDPLYVDAVVSNPPYSQEWDPSFKETDPRYARFGLAPKTKADFAFLLHDLYHLKPDGVMTIVLPHGVLFRGRQEGEIRKNLIEANHIDAIIGLPANIFFGTPIPTVILVIKQKRESSDILVIDASKGFVKEGKNNKLRARDIRKIIDVYIKRASLPKFSRTVSREEIRENDYNLNIPRYVDSSEDAETWDMYATMFGGIPQAELDTLKNYWFQFPSLRDELFTQAGDVPYVQLAVDDLRAACDNNADVQAFKQGFAATFQLIESEMKQQLLDNHGSMPIEQSMEILSNFVMLKIALMPLTDQYAAYQMWCDAWELIGNDIEIIQSEGRDAIRQVDPNMVEKAKAGKKQEVQEGWKGHIIPFELVQQELLQAGVAQVQAMENRLAEIESCYAELVDELSADAKEKDIYNAASESFSGKDVKAFLKEHKKQSAADEEELQLIDTLTKVNKLMGEESDLKKALKKAKEDLHLASKACIEGLSDAQMDSLLEAKWITPFMEQLFSIPEQCISELIQAIQNMAKKYEVSYQQIDQQISESEQELAAMLDELTGSDWDMKAIAGFQQFLGGA